MSDDIQYWKDSIIREIEEIQAISSMLPNVRDELEKALAIDRATKKIRNANGSCRTLKAEIRLVANRDENRRYRKELADYEQTLSQLSKDIKAYRSKESKNRLFLGANTSKNSMEVHDYDDVVVDDPIRAGDVLLDLTEQNQEQTAVSLNNTLKTIKNAHEIGMATKVELEGQRQQISNIENHTVAVETGLKKADKMIKRFRRRIATDKLIRVFALVNVVLLVGVFIVLML